LLQNGGTDRAVGFGFVRVKGLVNVNKGNVNKVNVNG
jgi:hypothetical protein